MKEEAAIEKIISIMNSRLDGAAITRDQMDENLEGLGMDSIRLIQIVIALEEGFGCEIPDAKLMLSEMNTVRKILDVIEKEILIEEE